VLLASDSGVTPNDRPALGAFVDQRWPIPAWIFLAGMVAGVAVLSALSIHHSCVHPPPPVVTPDAGTPLAGFCGTAGSAVPWLQAGLSVLVFAVVAVATRFSPRWALGAGIAICAANLILAIVAGSLDAAMSI
jgi:hypothetical protein